MNSIAFIDTEVDPTSNKILDIGGLKSDGGRFHKASIIEFTKFLNGIQFVCGHNILNHDIKFIGKALSDAGVNPNNIIDTLYLSPLLFPAKPYHALLKDDKLQTDELNNPLNDSIKAQNLFNDEIAAFQQTDELLKQILYSLLHNKKEFRSFFNYIGYANKSTNLENHIRDKFLNEICEHVDLLKMIEENPVELAYSLALINCKNRYSITPPWVLKMYRDIERIVYALRSKPCLTGCVYCNKVLDVHKGLKEIFGFSSYRTYAGVPLQENAVKAAVNNKSILAIFPTGGGKSITFQVPALISGAAIKGLTVVISPLQSLMKDQVDNLEKAGITEAVAINGLLDPIERGNSFERVENGRASLLYISPESLRSKTIERLLLGRKIARFVIDEAHCFSSWGQDFRVDYLYIGDFIKLIQEKKNLEEPIPVSCFTATAKKKVIEDICDYFKEKLSLDLEIFNSSATRTNLLYKVFEKENEEDKYQAARNLIEEKNCPTIIYVSRTKKTLSLAKRLTDDGFSAKPFNGKMEGKDKTANQDSFINGEVQIMVATSAFGMGVDKKDIGMVIHYEISDSLENYIQEAGRAGRDETISADCFVLFNEEDLSKHFILLNQTKLSIKEIQQVWKTIKDITKFRTSVSNSALEIARKAGWDDNVVEIETRVTTAIAALEEAGYLKRGQNMPRIFANSILSKNAQEAIEKIIASKRFDEKQKEKGIRIIKKLFSSKSKIRPTDEAAESRIDYISDHLGIVKEEVINIVYLLREEKILADTKDLTAFIKKGENINRSLKIVETYSKIENYLLPLIEDVEKTYHVKEWNEDLEKMGVKDITPNKIKTILNFWAIKYWIKKHTATNSKNHIVINREQTGELLKEKLDKRLELATFLVTFLYEKSNIDKTSEDKAMEEVLVEFSVHELKDEFERKPKLFEMKISIEDIEDTLFYLSRIEALKIEGGFLVAYNRLTIDRLEQDNKRRYKIDDYQKLSQFYENKVQQIHIVGEYAKKMINDYKGALQFVDDYFQLNYSSFLNKYFKGSRQNEIKRNITPAKFRQLFGSLSPTQLEIIKDNETKYIAVLAGPGSGKTRVLVHKLASLFLMEDVKHEQFLMLTFSRAAATEFKKRLLSLIGNAAHYIEIKTFHSYCFDLLGKVGSIEKSDSIIESTINKILNGEVEINKVTKTVIVIDEAQDMNADEYALVNTLIKQNEEMRVILVGDDDQNIYEFRGANSKYFERFMIEMNAAKYELVENYRSKNNLVEFTNGFLKKIRNRLKETPIVAKQADNGNIKIVHYQNGNLIIPTVQDILRTGLSGTTCVLTKTNDEALQVSGLLLKNGVPTQLIQSNEGFGLQNLLELRFLLNKVNITENTSIISDEAWEDAKKELKKVFQNSSKIEICNNLIKQFETSNSKSKYKSDLETFVRESKLEDFYSESGETIFVSTIHKSKGKEFDNIFIMLDNFDPITDEAKRQLYVAMTRAKQNLVIHLNGNYLNNINIKNLKWIEDKEVHFPPVDLIIHFSFKDVWLDYFITRQHAISRLTSGDSLIIDNEEYKNDVGQPVLKFSKQGLNRIETQKKKGYFLKKIKVNFILYWLKEGAEQEVKIILPELIFEKTN